MTVSRLHVSVLDVGQAGRGPLVAVFTTTISSAVQAVEDVVDLVTDGPEFGPDVRRHSRDARRGASDDLSVDEDGELEDARNLEGGGQIGAVEQSHQVAVLVLVLEGDVVRWGELISKDSLHHQDQLVVSNVLIMDGDPANVVAESGLDHQLPCQVHLSLPDDNHSPLLIF